MSILMELVEKLKKNGKDLDSVEKAEVIRSIDSLGECIQASGEPTKEGPELFGGTGMISLNALEIQEGTSEVEQNLSETLSELRKQYNTASSEEEKDNILQKIRMTENDLNSARACFDNSIKLNQDIRDDVRKIISYPKSPYYNPKGNKSFHEVDGKESGKLDGYHDKLVQLYGKDGVKSFFEKYINQLNQAIPKEDIEWASKRYKVVFGPIMGSPILSSIPILAGAASLYPLLASSIHIVPYAIGTFLLGTCFKKFITDGREKYNKRIFRARENIAIGLGLRKGHASWTIEGINANDAKAVKAETSEEK